MDITKIIGIIKNSSLEAGVREESVEVIRERSDDIKDRLRGLLFKPPSVHREFYQEIVLDIMNWVTPVFDKYGVSNSKRRRVYQNIYGLLDA